LYSVPGDLEQQIFVEVERGLGETRFYKNKLAVAAIGTLTFQL
jgi:hypothetical protein